MTRDAVAGRDFLEPWNGRRTDVHGVRTARMKTTASRRVVERRRSAEYITPIPKPKKHKAAPAQTGFVFDEGKGLSTKEQQYDPTSIINEVRGYVDAWRQLSPGQWQVSPETRRLLEHWRQHQFSGVRPFFCQVEAAETAIWLRR